MADETKDRASLTLLKQVLRADWLGGDAASLDVRTQDWPALEQEAQRAGFSSMLYAAGRRCRLLANAPPETADRLRKAYVRSLQHGVTQQKALAQVLEKFSERGLRVAVLKGAALRAQLYEDPAVRPMIDLDLLVPEATLSQSIELLAALGYAAVKPFQSIEFVRAEEGEIAFVKATPPEAIIDLHWHVFNVPGYAEDASTSWFWQQTVSGMVAGRSVLVFGHEALLLHLAVHHFVHHIDHSLKRTMDAALLLHRHGVEMDAEVLWRGACMVGMGHVLKQMLQEVEDEWGISTAALMHRLMRIEAGVARRATTAADVEALRSPLRHLAIGFSMANARRGMQYVLRQIFPHRHYLRQRYGMQHDWQAPSYYAVRFGRGVRQLVSYGIARIVRAFSGPAR